MNKRETSSEDVRHLYTETYFMSSATGHDEFLSFEGRYDQLIDKFRMVISSLDLKPTDSLLDIGCGRGEMVIYHALTGGESTGVDFSEEAIKIAAAKANELNAECSFEISSFADIDETLKYDKIISIDFIEHISASEGIAFFQKCNTLLNPGGKLLIYTFPNTVRRKYGYRLIRFLSILKGKPLPKQEPDTVSDHYKQYHLNEQSYFTLKESAVRAGFRKTQVTYFDPSVKDSFLKKVLIKTPVRHIFLKGLTLIAVK
jgi:cyclopropane fatty-acyl-phospholipid synthase-like methyltransferase